MVIAMTLAFPNFKAIILTKENVAAKALSDHIIDLQPPTLSCYGKLLEGWRSAKERQYQD